jgi:hypothetical protein
MRHIDVRWRDGYIESFVVTEWRAGADLLWLRLVNGHTRHIPLREVRWFEPMPNELREGAGE